MCRSRSTSTTRPAQRREVLGEDIERTRRHQTDARKSTHLDMPGDLLADSEIRLCQVEAGLTGSGMTTERHNEHVFGFDGSQGRPRISHGSSMGNA